MNKTNGRVLLIVHDVYQDDNQFPLGAGYLAAVLRRAGADVTVYSQDVYHYTNEELGKFLEEHEFDLIGTGFLAARFRETIVGLCRTVNAGKKGAWLILGGQGPSPIPEYVLETTGADVVAIGDAEETLVELLLCKLAGGQGLGKIAGIAFREGEACRINPRRSPLRELDRLPFPEWDLFPMEEYASCIRLYDHEPSDRYGAMVSSRGCSNTCNFCYRMEKGLRLRSIPSVIEEIRELKDRYGINYISMMDELFVFSKKRVREFRDALKENGLTIKFDCNARVNFIDTEMLGLLKECGCTFLNFGLESTSQQVLDLMNKRATVDDNERAVRLARESDIGIGLNFIWGNIGDTVGTLKDNVAFIKKYNTYDQLRTIRPVTPYPGCALYDEAVRRGLLKGPADFFDKFKNSDLLLVNFTDIPDPEFYRALFDANRELILDHHAHTTRDTAAAATLIDQFRRLYFERDYKFRGARRYKRESREDLTAGDKAVSP